MCLRGDMCELTIANERILVRPGGKMLSIIIRKMSNQPSSFSAAGKKV